MYSLSDVSSNRCIVSTQQSCHVSMLEIMPQFKKRRKCEKDR